VNIIELNVFYEKIIDFFYPQICPFCSRPVSKKNIFGACVQCTEDLILYKNGITPEDGEGLAPSCDGIYCTAAYMGSWKKAIISYKFKGRTDIAFTLAGFMGKMLSGNEVYAKIDYITCVPISGERFKVRGFNQSKLVAGKLSKMSGIPYIELLKRNSGNISQKDLNRSDRISMSDNQFSILEKNITGKNILLIDDILTTGSTLEKCAKILKGAGAEKVYGAVLASGNKLLSSSSNIK
jgi:ComF family protein